MSLVPNVPEPANTPPLCVLVVDDQAAVREGLARLIAGAPHGLRIVHTAATAGAAIELARRFAPQVVVLDVDLDGVDGLALVPYFIRRGRVLVLTSHGGSATRARARALGASAFVEKSEPAAVLLNTIAALWADWRSATGGVDLEVQAG